MNRNDNYHKDFDGWNLQKKALNERTEFPGFKKREIWYASIGVNIGYEIDGKNSQFERPVLVLHKINRQSAVVVPLTSTSATRGSYYVEYVFNGQRKSANIAQVRTVDARRFQRKVGMMSQADFNHIRNAFLAQFQ